MPPIQKLVQPLSVRPLQVSSSRPPFLPLAQDLSHLDSPEAALLDRQFRLMREDMVYALRQTMAGLSQSPPQIPASLQRNMFTVCAVLGIAEKPRPSTMIAINLPMSHRAAQMKSLKERYEFWTDHGRGTLPLDALVCLVIRPAAGSIEKPKLIFATVSRRDPKELAEKTPILGLSFDRNPEVVELLLMLGQRRQQDDVTLVQVCALCF